MRGATSFVVLAAGMLAGCQGELSLDRSAAAQLSWAPVVTTIQTPPSPIADGVRRPRCWEPPAETTMHFPGLGPEALEARFRDDRASLGSASIGSPTRGALLGAVELTSSEAVEVVAPLYNWGTAHVVASIERAARRVRCHFPDRSPLRVGSISRKRGGHLRPHRSHQSGRDADLGYFYTDGSVWYRRATERNLDLAATLTLLDALYDGGNVEYLFIDRSVKALLRAYAATHRPDLLVPLFDGPVGKAPLIRHARGHDTHIHVRFFDEAATTNGKRLIPAIVRHEPRLALRLRLR